jgi:hypothetical protein
MSSIEAQKPLSDELIRNYSTFFNQVRSMPSMEESDPRIKTINLLSDSFVRLSSSLNSVNSKLDVFTTNFNKINTDKLIKVLEANQPSQQFSYTNQPSSESPGVLSTIGNFLFGDTNSSKNSIPQSVISKNVVDTKRQNQFYDDVSEIRSILSDLREDMNKPSQAGSFHK